MLVKLVFVMQRLKNIWKIVVMINKDGGDTAVMRGDIELMGVPPVPALGKTLGSAYCSMSQPFIDIVKLYALSMCITVMA